jgi:CBS domain-containing protein
MKVTDILRHKGSHVATVDPGDTVATLVQRLGELGIGALVVTGDGRTIEGIVSERDVIRGLHREGPGVLDRTITSIMTVEVHTCGRGALIEDLMRLMTDRRIRHVPVVDDEGGLTGIVSIGDVVKGRIDDLQAERDQLIGYISR